MSACIYCCMALHSGYFSVTFSFKSLTVLDLPQCNNYFSIPLSRDFEYMYLNNSTKADFLKFQPLYTLIVGTGCHILKAWNYLKHIFNEKYCKQEDRCNLSFQLHHCNSRQPQFAQDSSDRLRMVQGIQQTEALLSCVCLYVRFETPRNMEFHGALLSQLLKYCLLDS